MSTDSIYAVAQRNLGKQRKLVLDRATPYLKSSFYFSRIFVADVTKNSPASICGLRDGDRILEVNGVDVQFQTYEEVLNRMKEHVELNDLDLLVLDKKAIQWYRERKFPISTETLPAIVQIEPFINVLVDENLNRDQSNENDEPAGNRN